MCASSQDVRWRRQRGVGEGLEWGSRCGSELLGVRMVGGRKMKTNLQGGG